MSWILLLVFVIILVIFVVFRLLSLFNYNLRRTHHQHKVKICSNYILLRDGSVLDSYLYVAKKTNVLLVFFHGFGNHLHEFIWLKQYCKEKNYSLLLPSRRNSGRNISKPGSSHKLGVEATDFFDIIQQIQQNFSKHRIIVLGHSLGASILAKCLSWKKSQKLTVEFVLINIPTNLKFLNPLAFIRKTPKSLVSFVFALLFKSSSHLQLESRIYCSLLHCCGNCNNDKLIFLSKLVNKYWNSPKILKSKLNKHELCLRKLPFYYFANFLSIFYWTFHNLSKNKISSILVVQGKKDRLAKLDVMYQNELEFKKTNQNIEFFYIDDFKHGFATEDKLGKNKHFINLILDVVIQKSQKLVETTIIKN